jgi:hypothetical protein
MNTQKNPKNLNVYVNAKVEIDKIGMMCDRVCLLLTQVIVA